MSTTDTHPLDAVSTPDLNAERLAALKRLFPDLFSNEGRLNVDELKKVVDPALVTESERYDFRWYGKTASKREAFTPSRATLIYDPARSVNPTRPAATSSSKAKISKSSSSSTAPTASASSVSILIRPTTPAKTSFTLTGLPKARNPIGSRPASPRTA
jgi:hypothetical protein